MKNNYCVYMHKNKINNKVYIGLTNDTKNRWRANGKGYKNYENDNPRPFYNAIKKYGWDNFEQIILSDNLSYEEACEEEIKHIRKHKSTQKKYGYNVSEGGNGGRIYKVHPKGMLGKSHSQETRIQQSKLMKQLNEEGKTGAVWLSGHPKGMLGKKHSMETKKAISSKCKEKNINCKKMIIKYPDSTTKEYKSVTETAKQLKVSVHTIYRALKSNKPYQIRKNTTSDLTNLKKIEGCIFEYKTENTEVN